MNEIIIRTDDVELADKTCRDWITKLDAKIDAVNHKLKEYSMRIRELEKNEKT